MHSISRSIPKNQKRILKTLLKANDKKEILAQVSYNSRILLGRFPGESEPLELSKFLKNPRNERYLEKQLVLFHKLCQGKNALNIERVSELVSLELVVLAMKDEKLSSNIRALFCDLLHVLYVDVGKNQPILKRIQVSPLDIMTTQLAKNTHPFPFLSIPLAFRCHTTGKSCKRWPKRTSSQNPAFSNSMSRFHFWKIWPSKLGYTIF